MTLLEILLILIGVGILIFSCFLVDNNSNKVESITPENINSQLTAIKIEEVTNKIGPMLDNYAEDTIEKTEEQLEKISNEKIIAVHDYSNQVLDKINKNHEEVVFLYNMLNEKENELKNIIKEVEYTKNNILKNEINYLGNSNTSISPSAKEETVTSNISQSNSNDTIINEAETLDLENECNHNKKILELYSQGTSILEISKTLKIGQGEIKLVLDLYHSK
jgi:hypothetical protein